MKKSTSCGLLVTLSILSSTHPARAATDPVPRAFEWLAAVRAKDQKKLTEQTHFPFVTDGDVMSPSKAKVCRAKMKAASASEFALVARCIIDDPLFGDSAPADTNEPFASEWKKVRLNELPKRMRKFKKLLAPLAKDSVFVTGPLPGGGITYVVVVAVNSDGKISAVVADSDVYE